MTLQSLLRIGKLKAHAPTAAEVQRLLGAIDRMSHGDCVEQLPYLRFLKMADERARLPFNLDGRQASIVPADWAWPSLLARDKASLDVFWLRDETLAESDNPPPPDVIAQEVVDDPEAALEQFRLIAGDLAAPA